MLFSSIMKNKEQCTWPHCTCVSKKECEAETKNHQSKVIGIKKDLNSGDSGIKPNKGR